MKMKMIMAFFLFTFSVTLAWGQEIIKPKDDPDCMQTIEFLRNSSALSNKPCGLAITEKSCPGNKNFTELKHGNLTLDKKLDVVIERLPNYKWVDIDGVINFYPSKSVPVILNTKIKEFKLKFDANNLSFFVDQLLKSPEIIEQQKKLNLREGMYWGGLTSPPTKRPPIELSFQNKTVQEILNELVRKRGRGCWLYREVTVDGNNTFTISFISL